MTGRILKHLHPDQKVRVQGFEKIEKPFTGYFDLVISNIPFGDVAVFDPEFTGSHDPARRSAAKTIHQLFLSEEPRHGARGRHCGVHHLARGARMPRPTRPYASI